MLRVQANALVWYMYSRMYNNVHDVLKYFSLMSLIDLDLHGFHWSV